MDLVGAPTFDPAFGRYALRGTGLVGGANLGFLAAREGERGSWEVGGDFKVDLGPSFYGDAVYELRTRVVAACAPPAARTGPSI